MLTFRDQVHRRVAAERPSEKTGELVTYVEVKIQGNYRKGPVPVHVGYAFHFRYEEEWTREDGFTVCASSKEFQSAEERDAYVAVHFSRGC